MIEPILLLENLLLKNTARRDKENLKILVEFIMHKVRYVKIMLKKLIYISLVLCEYIMQDLIL